MSTVVLRLSVICPSVGNAVRPGRGLVWLLYQLHMYQNTHHSGVVIVGKEGEYIEYIEYIRHMA